MIARSLVQARRWSALLAAAVVATACGTGPGADTGAEIARGRELYEAHCVECHGGPTGGEISDIPPRHNAEGHTWHHGDCLIIDTVLEGMPQREGLPKMPAFADELSEEDVRAILAYIKTWWDEDQREFQNEITAQTCD